ncbi:ACP phosphodiesterase [Flavobacterium sp. MK4S-17]|uniref:acyl carrier protein phosphodiesterase n=1 Tax=Flavobacterium sp. MK4S-17 TaxID=2543737 RepID=UPI00135C2BF9|nr:acyl carrier protein phosphodiesterase [Flavobacterium sp. MK4S-17]
MNFLAHIYLSGENDMLKIGNFMADSIHGRKPESFPDEICKGIMLHRAIDTFTDAHPVFRQSTRRLHPFYHHYSGVIVDIFYDHFLARDWDEYHSLPLATYARQFYSLLEDNMHLLTEKTKNMIPYMVKHDWLGSYATLEGIGRTLAQMDRRTKNKSGMAQAINQLTAFTTEFEAEFRAFFPEVQEHVKQKISELQGSFN